jgi:hypothetical protein
MSWNLNLCMEWGDRVIVPFHYFVKPEYRPTSLHSCLQFPFLRLPIDLQLIVYEFCNAPTLFQLMRTCSLTRRSTTKLFWENTFTDHWYHCPDEELFEYRPHSYTFLCHCPEFARRIQKVEIDLIRLELTFRESTAIRAKDFWSKVKRIFPSVRSVVLTGCTPRRPCPPPSDETDEDYATIETLVECAPRRIVVCVAFKLFPHFDRNRSPPHSLWQVTRGFQPVWQILDPDWNPTRVTLPSRKWPVSPLGDFLTTRQRYQSLLLEMRGIQWLMIESYARYAEHGTIHCPWLDCPAIFKQRDQWKHHLFESSHGSFDIRAQSRGDFRQELLCNRHTPKHERQAIEARHRHLETRYSETAKLERRVGYGWGPPGSEQRRLFEEEFKAQVDKEALYVPVPEEGDTCNQRYKYFEGLYASFVRDCHETCCCPDSTQDQVWYDG